MKTQIRLILLFFVSFAVHAQTTEVEWQREAIRRHPDLGVKDTPFNKAFIHAYQQRRNSPSRDTFFADHRWPMVLADECATRLAAEASQSAQPSAVVRANEPTPETPAAPPASKPTEPSIRLYVLLAAAAVLFFAFHFVSSRRSKSMQMPSTNEPAQAPASPRPASFREAWEQAKRGAGKPMSFTSVVVVSAIVVGFLWLGRDGLKPPDTNDPNYKATKAGMEDGFSAGFIDARAGRPKMGSSTSLSAGRASGKNEYYSRGWADGYDKGYTQYRK